MLGILEDDGIVRAVGGEFEVTRIPPPSDPQAQLAALLASSPMATSETTLTGRCGDQLAAVLRGEADPLPLLFPGGSPAAAEQIYQDSPGARTFNGLMQRAIAEAIAQAPPNRVLRVLEIGAGTGGTTASILPVLPADRSVYLFTDVSPAFTQRAADRFGAYPFVRYQLLDIEKDPLTQPGIEDQQFDVVIAVNVLHATRKLRETLAHVRRLLAPEGLLAIMEAIRPMRWLDLTFGLTDGWWRFADEDLRPSHPLLSSRQWRDLLSASGFEAPVTLPQEPEDGDSLSAQALLLARAPRVEVHPKPVARAARAISGDWLILADRDGVGARLAERVRKEGGNCVVVRAGEACSVDGDGVWRVNPGRPEDFHRLLAEARPSASAAWRGIVHLWNLDAPSGESTTPEEVEAGQVMGCGSLLHLVQAAIRGAASPIWVVTRGAQPVGPDAMPPAVMQSPVWGLGRVVSLEHPEFWGGLVDLDANDPGGDDALLEEIADPDGEDQVARRGSGRYVARLVRSRGLKTQPTRLRPDVAYLITGGLGRLGLKVARWMAEQGARHLVLMGRKGLPDRALWPALQSDSDAGRAAAAVTAIEGLGATVETVAGDASDVEQMSSVFARFGQGSPALRGVIHAAAAPGSVSLREMTLDALSSVLRPKVVGAWVLHGLTSTMDLDFFLMFSSTTGLLGARDLGHYAAANTFLDALAHYRRGTGRPAVSIDWGVWDELRGGTPGPHKTFAGAGLRHMPSPRALRALGHLLCSDAPQVVVASVDWATLKPVYEAKRRRPFLEQVGAPTRARPTAPAETGSDILQRLEAARPQDRRDLLVEHVRGAVAKVLRLEPGRVIELSRGLFDLGMDSLMSVELKSRLEASLGRPLPSTLTFNYPNVGALVDYLAKEALSLALSAPPEPVTAPAELVIVAADDGDMSEDELAMQLAEKLAELR
ncbi:MAG: hypothetical protein DMF77_18635 [Acidobacteria bacterium]|nr:MAG: hypothetical protein DMF77_18635 [Acidobacteriota bacterium]